MKLVIIRHAESNKMAGLEGEPDIPSPEGHSQIAELVKTCRIEDVEAVFHSTQSRAVFTAEALSIALSIPSVEQAGFEERIFGDWDNWEWSQIAAEYASVVIVTHWGPIRALLPMIKNEPKESTLDLHVEPGQAFVVDYPSKAE